MSQYHTHKWSPITDLPPDWRDMASPSLPNLMRLWNDRVSGLQDHPAYVQYFDRLRRQWAIETGIIERLYTLSEGATRTLIEKGLDAAFIGRDDTDQSPELVVAMIRDQQQAIDGLYQFVSGERTLSPFYIRSMHQVITAHQETCDAIDHLEQLGKIALRRGEWKKWPNNPKFADGSMFEYCPPEQVDSELQRLLELHERHEQEGVAADVEAAWLHHRFVLIHPFQDGNGRIARCLATLVLLKAHWLPVVVQRNDRADYLDSLRVADKGDLRRLVAFVGRLQQRDVADALALSVETVAAASSTDQIIEAAGVILRNRNDNKSACQDTVAGLAIALRDEIQVQLGQTKRKIEAILPVGCSCEMDAGQGWRDRELWGLSQHVHRWADALKYPSELNHPSPWVSLDVRAAMESSILFVIYQVRHCEGVYATLSTFFQGKHEERGGGQPSWTVVSDRSLCNEPFLFTQHDDPNQVLKSFRKWFEPCLERGLLHWKNTL